MLHVRMKATLDETKAMISMHRQFNLRALNSVTDDYGLLVISGFQLHDDDDCFYYFQK